MGRKKKSATMGGAAEIKVEGRDFVFQSCALIQKIAQLKECLKTFAKRLKVTQEKLEADVDKGVTEGPRSGILFPSMEAANQQAQEVTLLHLKIGLGVANRLQDVALDDLERVRKEIGKVLDSASTTHASDEEDPEAAGGMREAAG